jgi:hypothetical protein
MTDDPIDQAAGGSGLAIGLVILALVDVVSALKKRQIVES